MCRSVTCRTCGKTTWAGCGQHVHSVRRTVPASQWCSGHEKTESKSGFFSSLFRR